MPQYKGGRNINKPGYGGSAPASKPSGKVRQIIGPSGETLWSAPASKPARFKSHLSSTAASRRTLGR